MTISPEHAAIVLLSGLLSGFVPRNPSSRASVSEGEIKAARVCSENIRKPFSRLLEPCETGPGNKYRDRGHDPPSLKVGELTENQNLASFLNDKSERIKLQPVLILNR